MKRNHFSTQDESSPIHIPETIVAITGHRNLHDNRAVARAIRSVFADLPRGPLVLLCPLAEGADRLAAHEILRLPDGVLKAVLPLSEEDYAKDFTTPESRAEFRDLLARSDSVEVLPNPPSRSEVYRAVGCHVVEACDILLAVWDGLPARGRGGTAEVVTYARGLAKPLIIIDSRNPTKVTSERLTKSGGGKEQ